MTKTLDLNSFKIVEEKELSTIDGGLPIVIVAACVIWGVNAGLLTWGIRDLASKK